MPTRRVLAAWIVAGVAANTLAGQSGWIQILTATSLPGRSAPAMATDKVRQRVVMFGGRNLPGADFADTWEFTGTDWVQRTPVNSPSARYFHAMAYDSARQRAVLFGGHGASGVLADTWQWDGTAWLPAFSMTYPPAREGVAMAYDEMHMQIVIFGGWDAAGNPMSDTWLWNGTTWTMATPTTSPSARSRGTMAWDPAHNEIVLFGGQSTVWHSDTWTWNGANWTQKLPSTIPPGRTAHAMAFDASKQRIVVHGGYPPVIPGLYRDDVWDWDGANWQQVASGPIRGDHALAYDPTAHRVLLFGGDNGGSNPNDTWANHLPTVAMSSTYGTGCGSPPLTFMPDAGSPPVIGQTATATIANVPTFFAAVALGSNNQFFGPFALPVTLTGIGLNGCDLLQSSEVIGVATTPLTGTTMQFSIALPNDPTLVQRHLYGQAYALAPNLNPAWLIVSNGVDWTIGDA